MRISTRFVTVSLAAACFVTVFFNDSACNRLSAQENDIPEERGTAPEPINIPRKGEKLTIRDVPRDEVICFALYTTQDRVLKLSAQLYPLLEGESREVSLELNRNGQWQTANKQKVDEAHWMTTFRVEDWDDTKQVTYRVTHPGGAIYEGIIRANPRVKEEIVVAAFTGNSNRDRGPRQDIVDNVKAQDPDLLFFSGDQSYDHNQHYKAWLLFGEQFGEIIKDRPTVTIPDDHDVGQANLWGAAGKHSKKGSGSDGGYFKKAEYVNMVQRAQCAHLPDPYDQTPVGQDISVYYTSLNIGGIDFAIVEDRKWKTGPEGMVPQQGPRPDHVNNPSYDPATVDLPEARLLGERQLEFLREWGQDWENAEMKSVLSQTIFAGGAHIHGPNQERLLADMDSNGWPQTGRNQALYELRRAFAFHIAGDQHLATVIHHGTNQWEDAIWSFCVPSIVNFYGRWWWPLEDSKGAGEPERELGKLKFNGRYYDGFRNKVTMHAYANPTDENYNAAGYGIIRFNKPSREIVMECWPRHVDVTAVDAAQMPGWPVTIAQQDNYAREARGHLPTVKVAEGMRPVIQVIDQSTGESVYTLRAPADEFQPYVFHSGKYTLRVGEGEDIKEFSDLEATEEPGNEVLEVKFE
ncbi:hypothetical protein [Adhaeretor mobilis]|uniref:PhoD-like phosphatase n=1 Tax=Adhaeretor mobilis TaxID=1930276 RepID=A0A517N1J6_9BACT|nr:hypothetical protein [Adhaeretor mobilis]QDT01005.1 hypothetical protein HG15A2_43470 [Adhaeretor mobilis]